MYPTNFKSLNEECGVFGIWNHKKSNEIIYFGLHSLQHRGQEGAGIITGNGREMLVHRNLGLLSHVFKDKNNLEKLIGNRGIGHVRYSTCGNNNLRNVQPFLFQFHDMNIGVCHNGNLINARTLRKDLEKEGAIFHSTSDTEILVHLIRRSREETFKEKLKESLKKIRGGFSYLVLTDDALYGAVDTNSLRPLVIGKTKGGSFILASETCAIDAIGGEFIGNICAGELAIINDEGLKIEKYSKKERIAIAAMEYIYFARPDSNILNINVHTARKSTGRQLAREDSKQVGDIVIGVPNSSLSAASGYAEESGLPYEMGLIKNQYIARTFIQPTQELREQGVKMKLSPVKGVVRGKSVVMVDDSIVRGTTSARIVKMLKDAGAREVHVRIASPPFMFPSFYGIDVSTTGELIAANKSIEEIREHIGADSLEFLSIEGLISAIGLDHKDEPNNGLCLDGFTADYCAGLYDYKEEFLKSLTDIQKKYLEENKIFLKF